MKNLPFEVSYAIASFLETRDVQNLRLVNKHWSTVGIHQLDIDENFCITLNSLNRLEAVSRHPILSKRVHTIAVCTDILQDTDLSNLSSFLGYAFQPQGSRDDDLARKWLESSANGSSLENALNVHLDALKDHVRKRSVEQQIILESPVFEGLADVLGRFSNLKSCILSARQDFDRYRSMLYKVSEGWYCYRGEYAHSDAEAQVQRWILAALPPFLSELMIWVQSGDLFDGLAGFQQMTTLEIGWRNIPNSLGQGKLHDRDSWHDLIATAGPLQRLKLSSDLQQFKVMRVLKEHHWQDLHTVDLHRVYIDRPAFDDFLLRHKDSLQKLLFEDCVISSVWMEFFAFLRDDIKLKQLEIGGDLQSDVEDEPALWAEAPMEYGGVEVGLHVVVGHLVCGDKPDGLDLDWSALKWADIEEGYMSS